MDFNFDLASSTIERYEKNAMNICLRAEYDIEEISYCEIGDKIHIEESMLFDSFIDMSADWAANTYRLYSASMVWFFHDKCPELARMISENKYDEDGVRKRVKKGSALTRKSIKIEEQELLKFSLRTRNTYLSECCIGMFFGSVRFGLRPSEWLDAEFDFEDNYGSEEILKGTLKVRNKKATHGRSYGEFRKIRFALPSEEIGDIIYLFKVIEDRRNKGGEEMVRELYAKMKRCLRDVRDKESGLRGLITFYTARHQFSANAKSAGLSKNDIAVLMGHRGSDTASEHYGKKRCGTLGEVGRTRFLEQIRPHEDSVSDFNKINNIKGRDVQHERSN